MVVKPRLTTANTSENCFMMHRANLSVTLRAVFILTVERDWFWFWFWFYYALWLASVFTLVLVLRQSSENRSIVKYAVLPIRFCYWTSDVNVLNVVSLRALVRKREIYRMNDF